MKPVVAIFIADLHLSQRPPAARAGEPSWHKAMIRQLRQVSKLCRTHEAPLVIAGDLFHSFHESAECVNLALKHLPDRVFAVSGQHDQPHHRLDELHRSCYGTLTEAGRMINLEPDGPMEVPGTWPMRLHGFPFGVPVQPLRTAHGMLIEVAVVHRYLYRKDFCYFPEPKEFHLNRCEKDLAGYDVAVFGDNHIGWDWPYEKLTVWNCGAFIARTRDEHEHGPSVGLLHPDGTVTRHHLDVSKDVFSEAAEGTIGGELDISGFVAELRELGDKALDFGEAVERWLRSNEVADGVKREIIGALQTGKT